MPGFPVVFVVQARDVVLNYLIIFIGLYAQFPVGPPLLLKAGSGLPNGNSDSVGSSLEPGNIVLVRVYRER